VAGHNAITQTLTPKGNLVSPNYPSCLVGEIEAPKQCPINACLLSQYNIINLQNVWSVIVCWSSTNQH